MLVKQLFRVHQIIPHVAKKEKRLHLLKLKKLIVLYFDVNNQEESYFWVNQDSTINMLTMQINIVALFVFSPLKG